MPLMQGKSKKAFEKNIKTEMAHGKPQNQALAIAYSVKRKNKKMALGGEVNQSAKTEHRPMPEERDNDAAMVSRNDSIKPPHNDRVTDTPERKQAAKGMKTTRIKHPKMVPSDVLNARLRDEEDDLQRSAAPSSPADQPSRALDEEGPDRQGPKVPDMQDEHSTKRKPYYKGGEIEDAPEEGGTASYPTSRPDRGYGRVIVKAKGGEVEAQDYKHPENMYEDDLLDLDPSMDEGSAMAKSHDEEDQDAHNPNPLDMEKPHNMYQKKLYAHGGYAEGGTAHEMDEQPEEEHELLDSASIAASIMAKRRKMMQDSGSPDEDAAERYADGGMVDLSRNADEEPNHEDQYSFEALKKENYSESIGLDELSDPMDSNLHGDDREEVEENDHDADMVSAIRRKMKMRSPITR